MTLLGHTLCTQSTFLVCVSPTTLYNYLICSWFIFFITVNLLIVSVSENCATWPASPQLGYHLPNGCTNTQSLWSHFHLEGCRKSWWGKGEGQPGLPFYRLHHCGDYLTAPDPWSAPWFIGELPGPAHSQLPRWAQRTRFHCATLCPDFPSQRNSSQHQLVAQSKTPNPTKSQPQQRHVLSGTLRK